MHRFRRLAPMFRYGINFRIFVLPEKCDAIHQCSGCMVCAFPHVAFLTGTELRFFVDSTFEPIAINRIDDRSFYIFPLFEKMCSIAFVFGENFREQQQSIQSFGLCPPVFSIQHDGKCAIFIIIPAVINPPETGSQPRSNA